MALIPSTLQQGLLGWANTSWPSAAASAEQLATVYCSYASLAQAGGIPGIVLPSSQQLLAAQLMAADLTMVAPAWAQTVAAGLVSFWATIPFVGMIAPPVAAAGIPVFVSMVSAIFPVGLAGAPYATTIPLLATAFDAFTRLVIVTFPPPVGPQPLL